MKTHHFILTFGYCICLCLQGFAQVTNSGALITISANTAATRPNTLTCITCSVNLPDGALIQQNGVYTYFAKQLGWEQWLMVALPVIFFAILLTVVLVKLNKGEVTLADILKENVASEIDVPNPDPEAAKSTPFVKKKVLVGSSSRLAALLSSLCTVAIASCTCSYYFYYYIKGGRAPGLKGLYDVLLALGLGLVPYAVNKISSAFTRQ